MSNKVRIELEQAIELIQKNVSPLKDTETIEIPNLCGRITSKEILSPIDVPLFDRSPLDGYALCAIDTETATKESPVQLKVIDSIVAGECSNKVVVPGTAVRLMTGAPIPKGADCVIRQEVTDCVEDMVYVKERLNPFQNYCYKGEDIKKGDTLVNAGEKLNYAHAGVLSGCGIKDVMVYKNVKVAIVITGDEIWVGQGDIPPGKIYSSNQALLQARLQGLGAEVVDISYCADDSDALKEQIKSSSQKADMVITTGGASVGCKDLIPHVMQELGATVIFHGVNLKPGTPVIFSIYNGVPIIGLSGNPGAAIITFELLGSAALKILSGNKKTTLAYGSGVLDNGFLKASPVRRFLYAVQEDGSVHIGGGLHASGAIAGIRGCNCLLDVPAGSDALKEGDRVRFVRL